MVKVAAINPDRRCLFRSVPVFLLGAYLLQNNPGYQGYTEGEYVKVAAPFAAWFRVKNPPGLFGNQHAMPPPLQSW